MSTKLIELRPDRNLLNPDFNGYKLSLEKIPLFEKELETELDRILPNSEQYSLLHAKLFGLHNFIFIDYFSAESNVYFIDGSWNIQKIIINSHTGLISDIIKVWSVPQNEDRKTGRYNLSLMFPSKDIAVLSDGCGILYVIKTGNRDDAENWSLEFSEEVLENNKCFMIVDTVYLDLENNCKEIHCLLNNIDKNEETGKFDTVINWVTLKQTEDLNWGQVQLKVLKGSGQYYYCALERNCKFIYIASDVSFKFILDSENPIIDTKNEQKVDKLKVYTWLQTSDDITLRFNVNANCNKNLVSVVCKPFHITVKYNNTVLLEGELTNRIDSNLTVWTVENNILEITVNKTESGLMWAEFVKNNDSGEQIIDASVVEEVHQRLAHLCSETETIPSETGPAFSSQQIEECDFTGDDTAIFERLCAKTHKVTHRINLGSFQFISTVKLAANEASAMALRHDVDACLWQPMCKNDEWEIKHEGTLLAFGYVQASKQQRKFSTCSPTLNYSVICESTRHCFIYRQSREISSGELRNRRSGRRVASVAEQQVVNIGDEEILGIYAAAEYLYLLTEKKLLLFKIAS